MRAHIVFEKNVQYIVQGDEVVIVDEHTGRTMPGRRWGEGNHQAVEAKERVEKELRKLKQMHPTSAEATVVRVALVGRAGERLLQSLEEARKGARAKEDGCLLGVRVCQ